MTKGSSRAATITWIHSDGRIKLRFSDGESSGWMARDSVKLFPSGDKLAAKVLKSISEYREKVNIPGQHNRTAVYVAIEWNAGLEVIDTLISNGAVLDDVNIDKLVYSLTSEQNSLRTYSSEISSRIFEEVKNSMLIRTIFF